MVHYQAKLHLRNFIVVSFAFVLTTCTDDQESINADVAGNELKNGFSMSDFPDGYLR